MIPMWFVYLCLGIGISCAMLAGVFLAFSDFIMRALIAINPIGAIESMQMINVTVLRSAFLTTFFVMVFATLGATGYAVMRLDSVTAAATRNWVFAGTAVYLVTVILVTIVGNVPMNERLAAMPASAPDTITYWRVYGRDWTLLNHLRTLGSLITSGCFLAAMMTALMAMR